MEGGSGGKRYSLYTIKRACMQQRFSRMNRVLAFETVWSSGFKSFLPIYTELSWTVPDLIRDPVLVWGCGRVDDLLKSVQFGRFFLYDEAILTTPSSTDRAPTR